MPESTLLVAALNEALEVQRAHLRIQRGCIDGTRRVNCNDFRKHDRQEEPRARAEPVDRISEMLFGLFIALTFVGTVSASDSGNAQIRAMFIAALGCNQAQRLVAAFAAAATTTLAGEDGHGSAFDSC